MSRSAWCTCCGDEFDALEGIALPVDPEEPRFCSTTCEERWWAAVDAEEAYGSTNGGAPVWL